MKRYWKLITLATFVVVIMGTLFIQSSLATSSLPKFTIEDKSGDETEAEQLTIFGDYVIDDRTYIRTEISDEGTSYQNNGSLYLSFLREDYMQPEMKRLKKDYRNFIRGKHQGQISSFFEGQNLLAHVELKTEYLLTRNGRWTYSFVVDVLDKETKNSTPFELDIPEDEKYNYLRIQGVQLINEELKIITVNEYSSDNGYGYQEEIHIYTINLDTQKIVNDVIVDVVTTESTSNQWHSIYNVNNGGDVGPNKYFVFTVEKNEETVLEDGYGQETLERRFTVYNLETNEQESIELPEEYGVETYPELLTDSIVYFSKRVDNEIEIIGYDLESKQIETKQTFNMLDTQEDSYSQSLLINNKIYIVQQLSEGKADATIVIGDIQTGEILYEGLVELTTSSKDQQVKEMHINEMHVKKE